MAEAEIRDPAGGANQIGVRDHNERLILSLVQRHGAIASADIARRTGLSAQTVSVILRRLEADGLLIKGEPLRGKVGKPLTPVALRPEGVLSLGLKIGRRSCDLVLMDLTGGLRRSFSLTYAYPTPDAVMGILRNGLTEIEVELTPEERSRIAGIGIAAPFELWNWLDAVKATPAEMARWRDFDFISEIAHFCDYRVYVANDATAACAAEHALGQGRSLADYAYFFVGYFIGGGVVLNDAVYSGRSGNAGAFGTLPVGDTARPGHQLINHASLYVLERLLEETGRDPMQIWTGVTGWSDLGDALDSWIAQAGKSLAVAVVSVCAVIDFEAVLIDGAFPAEVRARLIERVRHELTLLDTQGILMPAIREGSVGAQARVMGAASLPISAQYLLGRQAFHMRPGADE